ncbi:MAG: hypothetical protein KatS3mg009_1170 [Acidimicrobiia bacterium]|nr:MAG: hypothetical protein KatS3mg009_1170 [Acidimicrobiia bacterium]
MSVASPVEHQTSPYVRLEGRLDAETSPTTLCRLAKHLRRGGRLFVDASRLESCDVSGLEMLRRLHDVAAYRGASIRLVRPSPPVRRALQRCGLGGIVLF